MLTDGESVVDYVRQLWQQGFDLVYHLDDKTQDDRDYFVAIDEDKKRCQFIQVGPNNEIHERSHPFVEKENLMNAIRAFDDYRILTYKNR